MKLFFSIFIFFAHLFSTVGFSLDVHECGGEKSYTVFGISLHDHCECDHDSKDHHKDCCKDKKSVVKGEHKDKISHKGLLSKKMIFCGAPPYPAITSVNKPLPVSCNFETVCYGCPPGNAPPLYLLYRDFLI